MSYLRARATVVYHGGCEGKVASGVRREVVNDEILFRDLIKPVIILLILC